MEAFQINFSMLNPYEASILSRRPLSRPELQRLWKSTLSRFLLGNGVQCHSRDDKHVLVDLVVEMSEDEEEYIGYSFPLGEDLFNYPSFAQQPASPSTPLPRSSAVPPRNSPCPATPSTSHRSEQCQCHECRQGPPPVPQPVPAVPAVPAAAAAATEGVFAACHALLDLGDVLQDDDFEQSGVLECACSVSVEALLHHSVDLGAESQQVLRSMAHSSVAEVAAFLQTFGVDAEGSGCRIHLLLQLRDLLEEQTHAAQLQAPPTGPAAAAAAVPGLQQRGGDVAAEQLSQLTLEPAQSQQAPTAHASAAAEENADAAERMRECCICLQNPREIAFVPCGHALCCRACARKLRECPVCRKKVLRRLKLFFS